MARTRQPRRHLLSVIRQKVSPPKNKHNERGARSQGGGTTPLANPHHFLACPLRKFGLATCSAKLLHPTLGRDLPLASRRQRGTQRAPTSCVAPPGVAEARATHWVAISQLATKKLLRPTVIDRAPWEIIPDKLTVYRFDFLLRRGARCSRHSNRACRLQSPLSARWRKSTKQLSVVWSISYSSSRARVPVGNKLELPLRRAGGAVRHSVGAIRARKTGKNNPGKTPGRARPQGVLLA